MKRLLILLFIAFVASANAQVLPPPIPLYIEPLPVQVSFNKLTNIVFHYRIKAVEVGSNNIIASQLNDTALVLQAANKSFPETNLSVYAGNGKLYSFLLRYADSPVQTSLMVSIPGDMPLASTTERKSLTDADIDATAEAALMAPYFFSGHRYSDFGVSVALKSLYTQSDLFFIVLDLSNYSGVSYDIARWKFAIRDKKRGKRTATQEIPMNPVFYRGDIERINSMSHHLVVVVLPKFTIEHKEYCLISLTEKDGGRFLQLKLHNRSIVKARPL